MILRGFFSYAFILCLNLMTPAQAAADPEGISFQNTPEKQDTVVWYEPKVLPAKIPGENIISLFGKTKPNTVVQVNAGNIILIQQSDPKLKFQPKVEQSQVIANAKGFFLLRLRLPSGLMQVPIVFSYGREAKNSILLTMRVDPKDVSLNVKVIRAKKVIKIVQAPTARYSLIGGLAPVSMQQKSKLGALGNSQNNESAPMTLKIGAEMKYSKWWWLADYTFGKAEKSTLQSMSVGGRYLLSDAQLWLDLDIDAQYLPLIAINNGSPNSEQVLIDSQVFRAGIGITYFVRPATAIYQTSFFYRMPFSIKADRGQVIYNSLFTASLEAAVLFPYENRWSWGLGVKAEQSSFKYEYNNTPAGIVNSGEGANTFTSALLKIQYDLQ